MLESIKKYTINKDANILCALKCIDYNKKGFVIVLDSDNVVLGVVTDGDIRRSLINGKKIDELIYTIVKTSYVYLNTNDDVYKCIEFFKNTAVKFLPIIDNDRRLVNIITREQLHSLLLKNLNVDLHYDFSELDKYPIDFEIYGKPWGFYKTNVLNDFYQSKVLCIKPLQKLSLQLHIHRDEYWVVVHGEGQVVVDDSIIDVSVGSFVTINKTKKHRAINISKTDNLIINEVQIGDYLGEDDIVRYEDEYGRSN